MPKVAVTVGTRPEIIKMSPVVREMERRGMDHYIIHSGQHYSYGLDEVFFKQLGLPKPRYRLDVGSASPPMQTAMVMEGAGRAFAKDRPDVVLVQGDTNTVLGAAVAASKLGIPVGHVEAGLRSYDMTMQEEINRRLTDHCSDYLFAPTLETKKILLGEGIPKDSVLVTGNTIVDAVLQNVQYAKAPRLKTMPDRYVLASIHRQENVDDPRRFKDIARALGTVSRKLQMPVIYPMHPRSKKMAGKFGVNFGPTMVTRPMDYFAFLWMLKGASLVMTDSGGVQEEACVLGVPCVTLRDNTERPETVRVGANVVAGTVPRNILECARAMIARSKKWRNPFGAGDAAIKIADAIKAGR